jgi:hypothetical protein
MAQWSWHEAETSPASRMKARAEETVGIGGQPSLPPRLGGHSPAEAALAPQELAGNAPLHNTKHTYTSTARSEPGRAAQGLSQSHDKSKVWHAFNQEPD